MNVMPELAVQQVQTQIGEHATDDDAPLRVALVCRVGRPDGFSRLFEAHVSDIARETKMEESLGSAGMLEEQARWLRDHPTGGSAPASRPVSDPPSERGAASVTRNEVGPTRTLD
ncbi:MAG TPA: hypothetical protein VFJ50_03435 [Gemmatimonadales bacterium]|nr:hypothetical protein [Gemmatimonadales bacterium]